MVSEFCICFLVFFIGVLLIILWSDFVDLCFKRLDTKQSRKRFKEKYVKDEYYDVISIFNSDLVREDYIVRCDENVCEFMNEVVCHNEENARLICTILNVDAHYKKFDVKAYLNGYDINILKSLKEGTKE